MTQVSKMEEGSCQITFVSDQQGQGQYRTLLPYNFLNSIDATNMVFMPVFTGDKHLFSKCNAIRFQRQCSDFHLNVFKQYLALIRQLRTHNRTKIIFLRARI